MEWTVDLGQGPRPCRVPHVWGTEADVRWEGPAVYRTTLTGEEGWLLFHGASYQATVRIDGSLRAVHRGIWDAFSVPVPSGAKQLAVEVVKNGGAAFPVKDVLSGFLPYVHQTFGGLFREVEFVKGQADPLASLESPAAKPRSSVDGHAVLIDGKPLFLRGALTWGWYPEVGAPHPSAERLRDEARRLKELGVNLVKYCLWLPPHHAFSVLEEFDLWAWVELPLWLPTGDPARLEEMLEECERIVRQYQRHDRIVLWTCGCELSEATPPDFRRRLFEMVKSLTGCPLVRDNSGGSEMYGGDLVEFADFDDFHPYCDGPWFLPVVESLMPGARAARPILFGETNDFDAYRPLGPLRDDLPAWASSDPALNDQGVRWQYDLPGVLDDPAHWTRAESPEAEEARRRRSVARGAFARRRAFEAMAARPEVAGWVVTGAADTPISTSGILEAGQTVDPCPLFLVPDRRPPWRHGGNRPGWLDPGCHFVGGASVLVGSREPVEGWEVSGPVSIEPVPAGGFVRGRLRFEPEAVGRIQVGLNGVAWDFELVPQLAEDETARLCLHDPHCRFGSGWKGEGVLVSTEWDARTEAAVRGGEPALVFLDQGHILRHPAWRECVWDGQGPFEDWAHRRFELQWSVSPDAVLDPAWVSTELPGAEWLVTRVDTRTYIRTPYVVAFGRSFVTTLRPWGGLGSQSPNFADNPAGQWLVRHMAGWALDRPGALPPPYSGA